MTAAADQPRVPLRTRLGRYLLRRLRRKLPFLALYAVLAATGTLGELRDRAGAEIGPAFAEFRETLETYSALKRAQLAQAKLETCASAPVPRRTEGGHAFQSVAAPPDC
ncbi:hypothetical protein [uncultured Jannaschia sp.]|uniref:hypothetical protein n=1 Tax=uncultured Jannaschia sp. TaxID=293347 RepID=UPI002626149E|nr:hypothetical protein [uncultured Jannaschia sp.]